MRGKLSFALKVILLTIVFVSSIASSSWASLFLPTGTKILLTDGSVITTTQPHYLHNEAEIDAIIAAYQYQEMRADKNQKGLEKIEARMVPLEDQLAEVVSHVQEIPQLIELAAKKSYWKGFREGGILGFVIGGSAIYLLRR